MPKVLTEEFNPEIFKMVARSGFDPFSHMNLKLMHCIYHECLKGPSQPLPFSMPLKLLILHGEVKSECFTIGYVLESTFNYL